MQPPFYNDPGYIAALVMSAEDYLAKGYDYILFSYHGLPERQIKKSDPTGCHCLAKENCCEAASPAHAEPVTAAFISEGIAVHLQPVQQRLKEAV